MGIVQPLWIDAYGVGNVDGNFYSVECDWNHVDGDNYNVDDNNFNVDDENYVLWSIGLGI